MNILTAFYQVITGLGSYLLLPIFFFVLGLIAHRGWKKSAQCAMAVLGSLVGISILISRLSGDLLTTTNSMIQFYGLSSEAVNLHWSLSSAITYTSQLLYYIVPLGILVNALLILAKATRVVNLDLWSYWQIAFVGTLVENLTGSFWYGFVCCIYLAILQLLLSGAFAPQVSNLTGARYVTFTQSFALGFAPITWGVNWLIDRVPAFCGKRFSLEESHEKWGFWGEPALWGLVLGLALSLASGRGFYASVEFALVVAGCLYVLPRLLLVLARAISSVTIPLNQQVAAHRRRKVPLQFAIGAMAGVASPTVILTAILMVPVSVVLGYLLPGNLVLPQGDIAMLLYLMVMVVALSGRCLIRSLISGIVSVIAMLYSGTALTQLVTKCAAVADPNTYTTGLYNTLCNGANPLAFLTMESATFGIAGVAALGVITLGIIFLAMRKIQKDNAALIFARPKKEEE